MSSTSPLFTGTSTYSSDFANVVNRAVQIASLPMNQLTREKSDLSSQQSAMNGLSSAFTSLKLNLAGLGSAASAGGADVTYTDSSIASATTTAGALVGTYSLEVVDAGSRASAASAATVTDPGATSISTASSFTLTVNGQQYQNIQPAANNLNSLAQAINSATLGAVQATVVNVGSPSSPSYQLSIQNSKYGASTISLDDGSGNLLGTPTTATSVKYRVNGQPASPATISSDTRALNIAPNLSVTVLKTGSTDITVSRSTSAVANAITQFVNSYNAAKQALNAQRGQTSGALAGQSLINTLSQSLASLANYTGSGAIRYMSELGLTFDKSGTLNFDPAVLSAAAAKDSKAVDDFLGSPTTGGFLQNATNIVNAITDTKSGAIPAALTSVGSEISSLTDQISRQQDRIDQIQADLTSQMAAADALIASLQQKYTYMNSLMSAMQTNQDSLK